MAMHVSSSEVAGLIANATLTAGQVIFPHAEPFCGAPIEVNGRTLGADLWWLRRPGTGSATLTRATYEAGAGTAAARYGLNPEVRARVAAAPALPAYVEIVDPFNLEIQWWVSRDSSTREGRAGRPISLRPTQAMDAALSEIAALQHLGPNWDGEGAPAPNAASIAHAANLLLTARTIAGDLDVSLHADGRVILERQNGESFDEIIAEPGGVFTVWSERPGAEPKSRSLTLSGAIELLT